MPAGKRILDVCVSASALIVLSPVLLLAAAAVWIESGRPVLFAQERVGRGARRFTLWKFRSMRSGEGPLVTTAADMRITRVGKVLRKTKLDELPQFWNVLLGDMSLVGPRPEVPAYVDRYRPQFERILRVRPGITDPASIAFRDEETLLAASEDPERTYLEVILPAKLRLSEEYLELASVRLDLQILIRTLFAVACNPRHGAAVIDR